MTTQTKSELMERMDQAAHEAHEEIDGPDVDAFKAVAQWWARHYLKTGHKRLGRIVLGFKDVR